LAKFSPKKRKLLPVSMPRIQWPSKINPTPKKTRRVCSHWQNIWLIKKLLVMWHVIRSYTPINKISSISKRLLWNWGITNNQYTSCGWMDACYSFDGWWMMDELLDGWNLFLAFQIDDLEWRLSFLRTRRKRKRLLLQRCLEN